MHIVTPPARSSSASTGLYIVLTCRLDCHRINPIYHGTYANELNYTVKYGALVWFFYGINAIYMYLHRIRFRCIHLHDVILYLVSLILFSVIIKYNYAIHLSLPPRMWMKTTATASLSSTKLDSRTRTSTH